MRNSKPTTTAVMMSKEFAALVVVLSIALLPPVAAHKYFFGLTEVSYNSRTEHVEVVHQYTLHDVQRALKQRYGDDFLIDSPGADTKIKTWLENHFQLFDSNANSVELTWVGFEADFQNIWLYQESAVSATNFCGWRVSNDILMKAFAPQVNTVNFVSTDKTDGVSLTRQQRTKTVNCE